MLKNELWNSRSSELRDCKSKPWTEQDLIKVLKTLKNDKAMDPNGMINEIFKPGCIGSDLLSSLLSLMNGIKSEQFIPDFIQRANISTIYKNKGSRLDLDNDRGIFVLTVMKKILDKLIYCDKYDDIDSSMSDSNIGARKQRNIKNHLFIIYGVINNVIRDNLPCIDLQIYDIMKAFDALWLEDCMNDLYDSLHEESRDDKVVTIYLANQDNLIAVNTAVGLTDRVNIKNIVQQGGTWGSLLCSNSIDSVCRKSSSRRGHLYYYKK